MENSEIAFTKVKLPFGWLGNMSRFPITYDDKEWLTNEALFQALRFAEDDPIREEIRAAKSPMAAKLLAKKEENAKRMIVKPQSDQDIENMMMVIRIKIDQHPDLKRQLLETGIREIIEDCTKRQRGSGLFWGAARTEDGWTGNNILGFLWMELRHSLRNS